MRNQSSFFVRKLFARPTRCTPIRWILSLSKGPIEFDDSDRDNSALRRDGQDPSAPTASSRNARLVLLTPLAGYALFIAKSVVGPVNMTWALLLLVWAIAATFLAWRLTRADSRILDRLDRHAVPIVTGLIVLVAGSLVTVSVWQARHLAMSVYTEDTAYYSQVLWNTLHGNVLSGNVQQERLYNPPASNDLAVHVSPIPFGLLLPAYAVFPHFLTLLIIRDVALAAAAWPLFLLARERMGGGAGVAAVALYLSNPAVVAQGFESFTLLHLAPLPFFWAFRAFVQRQFHAFLGWTAIALGVREDVAITMAGFGLWALVGRRGFRWVAVGLGIPVVWWAVVTLVIQPAFQGSSTTVFDVLAGGTHSPIGVYGSVLTEPWWIITSLKAGGVYLLYALLRSVGFVAALGPEGLVAAPGIAAILFAARMLYGVGDPLSRFALLPSCALVGAAVVIVSRLGRRNHADLRVLAFALLLLLPSASLLDGVKNAVQERLVGYIGDYDVAALSDAIARIPAGAPVAAPVVALPALSKRSRLLTLQYLDVYPEPRVDYFLLDRRFDRVWRNPENRERYVELFDDLTRSPDYETVWQRGDYLVLRRREEAVR